MELRQVDIDKFNKGRESDNPRFWSRFSEKPDLTGATVLDVGCGWGSLCVDMALAGAQKVVGLDLKSELIDFANENLKQSYPELTKIVEFKDIDLKYYYDDVLFDFIVSKDTFEHIIDLAEMLSKMKKRLKPGGRVYAGFGPLYTSPYGDHDRRRTAFRSWRLWGRLLALIPWGHLLMESTLIEMSRRYRGRKINSVYDLGLNRMSVSDFRRVFRESGLSIIDFRVNQSNSIQSKVFSLLRRIPFLEDYCTHNIYCILEKR